MTPPDALKMQVVVTAGLVLGQPVVEWTRTWQYTAADAESDSRQFLIDGSVESSFSRLVAEAHQYALSLCNPRLANWVNLKWIWI